MKKKMKCLAFLLCAILIVSSSSYGVITVTSIQMDPAEIQFFNYDSVQSQFVVKDALTGSTSIDVQQGDLSTNDGAYKFDGQLIITPSDMTISAGDAAAFSNTAGATVSTITIVADVVWKEGGIADVFGSTVTLLEADMVAPASPGWILSERTSNAELYTGQTDYVMTGGVLFNGGVMLMTDFTLGYGLNGVSPINQEFSQSMTSMDPEIKLQAPIPEPATLLMLGMGGLLALRMKK